ncbi:30S ribosomal protein S17 [Candidatus Parcubacteria bacterium]|nr:MAG: 30S ribosomal protein S17 [Candidatus Parcubacteria bacterium]
MNSENGKVKYHRQLRGVVVSDKMQKTIVVAVSSYKKHSKYQKYFKLTKRFKVHDPDGKYHVGDRVIIKESRPLSKEKRWVVVGSSGSENK